VLSNFEGWGNLRKLSGISTPFNTGIIQADRGTQVCDSAEIRKSKNARESLNVSADFAAPRINHDSAEGSEIGRNVEAFSSIFRLSDSAESQTWVPRSAWMMPVLKGVEMPESFSQITPAFEIAEHSVKFEYSNKNTYPMERDRRTIEREASQMNGRRGRISYAAEKKEKAAKARLKFLVGRLKKGLESQRIQGIFFL
jgi:hypothetical protein